MYYETITNALPRLARLGYANKSKEVAMKTSDRVQAASGGLAGIINL